MLETSTVQDSSCHYMVVLKAYIISQMHHSLQ